MKKFLINITPFARPAQQMAGPMRSAYQCLRSSPAARLVAGVSLCGWLASLAIFFVVDVDGGGIRLAQPAACVFNLLFATSLIAGLGNRWPENSREQSLVFQFGGIHAGLAALGMLMSMVVL